MDTELLLSVCLGLGLSAATGFRVFLPLLILNLAAKAGWVTLGGEFAWLGDTPALVAFSAATLLELGGYYIPWLDNLLDSVATPAAVVAGTVATASVVTGMQPGLKWTLAVIAGGGIAGTVQATTVGVRQLSTVTTGGLGNPLVATLETVSSVFLSLLAIIVPILASLMILTLLVAVWRRLRRRKALGAAT